jgi:glutamate dehydrogenase
LATQSELDALIERSVPREDARRLKLFADSLFSREPRDASAFPSAAERLAIARAAWELFEIRTSPMCVRVQSGREGITVVDAVMRDCPFIIDSLLEYFRSLDAAVRRMLHPVIRVARERAGRVTSIEQANALERGESLVHVELELVVEPERIAEIQREIESILSEVRFATDDYQAMTERALAICAEIASQRELVEVREFLRWLADGGYVFLGYCRFTAEAPDGARALVADPGSELGVLRGETIDRFGPARSYEAIAPPVSAYVFEGPPLLVAKTRAESHVHRRRPMDSITVRRTAADGSVAGFDHFIGLFTSKAYGQEAQRVPILRAKLQAVLDTEKAPPGSHDYKEIVAAFNSFPKDELFRASIKDLRQQLRLVLDVQSADDVRLHILSDTRHGEVVVLVVMPRDAFSAEVRLRIQEALARRLGGTVVYYYLALGEGYTARLHFCFAAPPVTAAAIRELEIEVPRLARSWEAQLRDELHERFGATGGNDIWMRWRPAFPADYKAHTGIERAIDDISQIEALAAAGRDYHVAVVTSAEANAAQSEIRILGRGESPMLSDLMPTLQNFGINVLAEDAHEFAPVVGGQPARAFVAAFRVDGQDRRPLANLKGAGLLAGAITAVRDGCAEDDALNAIVLTAGLNWRETALLRAYLAVAYQMRLAPARPTLRRVLLAYPDLARLLVELFTARLDPDDEPPAERIAALRAAYLDRVAAIENITEDRVARILLSMVEGTVRTNYFRDASNPSRYIALKFASGRIMGLPGAAPLYEIHVHCPGMEGCHLRAGRIARGGIRVSDRPDDYRTEILGLMKTQSIKNAIIVPVGAKGGFIVKARRGQTSGPAQVAAAYETLINAVLDLTSNVVNGAIADPPRVKVLDEDGAYLVVAADKGTATMSDTANAIAQQHGFWLGDAFASGGRHGYDHKRMGITARGAWESAKRHLREMGRGPLSGQPVVMVGIGDMSGDVFGNMLVQSNHLKLVAAFDHRHIFIDPNPDPIPSHAERKRLFELPQSQWSHYNPSLISTGGGLYRRGQKRIELSAKARTVLGCGDAALDSEALVGAILRAPVELLFNGGIGTFVRASDESDDQVADHANDACRISAAELRASVVVEGGNLGFTQRARIEYALAGGRINTDAIDNSAGVDTSDHEVNLKILMQPAVARGELQLDERNRLLFDCTGEVAARVLRDNRDQVLSLSLEQVRSRALLTDFRDQIKALEERGALLAHEDTVPNREALRDRRARYSGLTRPELAVLVAHSKIDLVHQLEATPLLDDPYLIERYLRPYFPPATQERFARDLPSHGLRRELVATQVVNALIDLMGSTFVPALIRDFGCDVRDAVWAWLAAVDIVGVLDRAEHIKGQAPAISTDAELNAMLAVERCARLATQWVLANGDRTSDVGAVVGRYRPGFVRLTAEFEPVLASTERERFERRYRELRAAISEGDLAHELARLDLSAHMLSVVGLALSRGADLGLAAQAYFGLAERIDFATLEAAADTVASDDRWERRAARELHGDISAARAALAAAVLSTARDGVASATHALLQARAAAIRDVDRLTAEFRMLATPSLSALEVTVRALTRLAQRA